MLMEKKLLIDLLKPGLHAASRTAKGMQGVYRKSIGALVA